MSASSMCDGLGRTHEFMLVLEKAGFDDNTIQSVINSRGNELAKMMYGAIENNIGLFDIPIILPDPIVVPDNYCHDTCLATFRKKHEAEFGYYNPDTTDKNFAGVTTKLTPGRKLQLKLIPIKEGKVVSSADCLAKLEQERAVLAGAQGLSLVYEQAKDKLPKSKYYPSFDKENVLPVLDGYHRVPYLYVYSDGGFYWNLGSFEGGWHGFSVLVGLCDWPGQSA